MPDWKFDLAGNELSRAASNSGNKLSGTGSPRTHITAQENQPAMEPLCNTESSKAFQAYMSWVWENWQGRHV